MPNNEMDYSLIHRTPDGNGKILVTTPGSPDKGSWETEAELKTYVNQDVNTAINTLNTRVTNIEETLMGENEITVQYPSDSTYTSLMPNRVPARALKFAEVPRFRGKSRAWNQLAPKIQSGSVWSAYFFDSVSETNDKIAGTVSTKNISASFYITDSDGGIPMISGHKYLVAFYLTTSEATISCRVNYMDSKWSSDISVPANAKTLCAVVVDASSIGSNKYFGIYPNRSAGLEVGTTVTFENPFVRDLTLIFPDWSASDITTANIPLMVQQVPDLLKCNAYGAGSLVDTEVSGVKSVGVNIWDEEWELGEINNTTGQNASGLDRIRSKNYIPVHGSTAYHFKAPSGNWYIYEYDADNNFIGVNNGYTPADSSFTTSINCAYIRFRPAFASGTSYNHDIQICLNSYPDKTTYHPYKTDTLSLPETVTLRSAGSVADTDELNVEVVVDGVKVNKRRQTVRVELGNLGDYNWTYIDAYGIFYADDDIGALKTTGITCCCASYLAVENVSTSASAGSNPDKSICLMSSTSGANRVYLRDSSKTGADLVNGHASWLENEEFTYAIATESVTLLEPIIENFIEVQGGGTVETIQTQTPVIDNCLDVTYDIIPQ